MPTWLKPHTRVARVGVDGFHQLEAHGTVIAEGDPHGELGHLSVLLVDGVVAGEDVGERGADEIGPLRHGHFEIGDDESRVKEWQR